MIKFVHQQMCKTLEAAKTHLEIMLSNKHTCYHSILPQKAL